ncbi:polycomb group RING finger protein 3 [Aplysia californica]|uniref:Polycomb group RING finger protein 3 n=1 Tax=Aplysia californica TaxID=6500 RepID=A0ABM0ZZ18_APLCA|nr:polycomb group RING finger protein 3 [Aplysia californica]XP_012937465.1 polycomb group RING finger protein 3 [Aplysia californica]
MTSEVQDTVDESRACAAESSLHRWPRRIDENNTLWIPIHSVNPHLICGLCQGYLYEACTITECMHSFCKNCIVKHLERSLNCPMCAILIHPTDPFVHIRLDGLLQDIVYALLPHVEKEELERERLFYEKHGDSLGYPEQKKEKSASVPYAHPGYPLSLSKSHPHSTCPLPSTHTSHRSGYVSPVSLCLQCLNSEVQQKLGKQYVRVTGGATVRSLSVFLKKKLQVEDTHNIELYCPCKSGFVSLSSGHTLKAVKDLYCYDQDILHLKYDISEQ